MSALVEARLWWIQRLTAMVLAVCVLAHLATIVYAVRGGLHAADILARTRGNLAWGAFYGIFVLAAAAHGAVGIRTVAIEWLRLPKKVAFGVMLVVALVLATLGLVAVRGVLAS